MTDAVKTYLYRALIVIAPLVLFALFALGFVRGSERAQDRAADTVRAANIDAALWQASAEVNQQALTDIATRLRAQAEQLRAVRTVADAALHERDEANARYAALREQRKASIRNQSHENPDCADLARPLCPAVAERLFGRPSEADATTQDR